MKRKNKRSLALFLVGTLLAGILPIGTGVKSWAAEQITLRNPRFIKTTQEMTPGTSEKRELKNPTIDSNGITTWDCIWFGNYWQEDTNGDGKADKNDEKTPIKWRVLSVDGDDVFLLADKNLDCQKYNDTDTGVTWETCTMRSWLNGYGAEKNKDEKDYGDNNFLDNAFSETEQSTIKTTNVVNDETEGGNDTTDKVYLLSIDEVRKTEYGFTSSDDNTNTRMAVNTAYVAGGGEIKSEYTSSTGSAEGWWLRSPGYYGRDHASIVNYHGYVNPYGYDVNYLIYAVRPALHLNLSSLPNWSYAGTVPSDDVAEWDSIWFGNYWQEDTNGDGEADKNDEKTPIKWRVLSVDGDDAFLLADKNLDCQKYNDTDTNITWETCTMRSWLNGYGVEKNKDGKDYSDNNFLNNAFSVGEQSVIKMTNVENKDNEGYETDGGKDTMDKVYLLSINEVRKAEYGFKLSDDRTAVNTSYVAGGGEIKSKYMSSVRSTGDWWLRSPGSSSYYASYVDYHGDVIVAGDDVNDNSNAVRPVLHLNLSSASGWSYAGIVASDGKIQGIDPKPTSSPKPTEQSGSTQKPQETDEPGETGKLDPTVSPRPTEQLQTTLRNPRILKTAQEVAPGYEGQKELKNPTIGNGIATWDCIWFGNEMVKHFLTLLLNKFHRFETVSSFV